MGEVTGGTGSIPGADRRLDGEQTQPQRVVAEIPRLGGAGGTSQRVGRSPVVSGQLGRLLVASLRLAGHSAEEAQLGQTDRQPVRLHAISRVSAIAQASALAQLVGHLVERRPPRAVDVAGRDGSRASAQARHQRRCRDRASTDSPASSRRSTPYWRIVSKAR